MKPLSIAAKLPAWRARPMPSTPDRLADLIGFGSNPGALRARIYRPANLPAKAPLVVVLHGCTQTAAGYDHGAGWSQMADMHGFALLFPEQQRANNPNLCFNWFVPDDTRRGGGEALSIRQMIGRMIVDDRLDAGRVFVTGLSAGGAMAMALLATYPEVFAGGAVIAGLPYGCAATIPEALERMRGQGGPDAAELAMRAREASTHDGAWPTLSIWHGGTDQTVAPSNAAAIAGQWRALHGLPAQPTRSEVVDGHARRRWCDADGRVLVEDYLVAGMGHGTPLATGGATGCGAMAPYMLEAGISSTRRIAEFWDIAPAVAASEAKAVPVPATAPLRSEPPRRADHAKPHRQLPAVARVIEDALRSAGLMR